MESLWSVLSIVIQFSGVFGIFYVIRGMYMFRKKKFPTAGFDETQKKKTGHGAEARARYACTGAFCCCF